MSTPGVQTGDREQAPSPLHPIVIVLDRLRSAYNVGNIFRLAEVCSIERIVTCGYTATPPHPKLKKTARGCDELVPYSHFDTSSDAVRELKQQGYHIYGVETVEGAPDLWDAQFAFPAAFVFGNEALGIHPETLDLCDGYVRLPVFGRKNSLNVSNCASAILYRALADLRELTTRSEHEGSP